MKETLSHQTSIAEHNGFVMMDDYIDSKTWEGCNTYSVYCDMMIVSRWDGTQRLNVHCLKIHSLLTFQFRQNDHWIQ